MIRQRLLFILMVAVSLLALIAFLLAPGSTTRPDGPLPALGRWIARHPADYESANRIVDLSLDLNASDERRFALWHAAHQLAEHLAPERASPHAAFVRAGLFHWYELPDSDRAAVLREVEPLLRDEVFFARTYHPLFELTGDLGLLRRANPGTISALATLADLAVTNGRFDDYRALRSELERKRLTVFEQGRDRMSDEQLLRILPPALDQGDDRLAAGVLDQLARRPLEVAASLGGTIEELVDYAQRRGIGPLDGLAIASRTPGTVSDAMRARLALAAGAADVANQIEAASPETKSEGWSAYYRERAAWEQRRGNSVQAQALEAKAFLIGRPDQWHGLCGTDLCDRAWRTIDGRAGLALRVIPVQSDEVPPYVEIYLNDWRIAEGAAGQDRAFEIPLVQGQGRIEVRLVNPWTRNRMRRRVQLEL